MGRLRRKQEEKEPLPTTLPRREQRLKKCLGCTLYSFNWIAFYNITQATQHLSIIDTAGRNRTASPGQCLEKCQPLLCTFTTERTSNGKHD
jgi:hypothetical protein